MRRKLVNKNWKYNRLNYLGLTATNHCQIPFPLHWNIKLYTFRHLSKCGNILIIELNNGCWQTVGFQTDLFPLISRPLSDWLNWYLAQTDQPHTGELQSQLQTADWAGYFIHSELICFISHPLKERDERRGERTGGMQDVSNYRKPIIFVCSLTKLAFALLV